MFWFRFWADTKLISQQHVREWNSFDEKNKNKVKSACFVQTNGIHFAASCSAFHRHKSIHKYCGREPFICSVTEIATRRSLPVALCSVCGMCMRVVRGVQSKWCWWATVEFMQHSVRSGLTIWLKCSVELQLNRSPISVMNHFDRKTNGSMSGHGLDQK